MRGQYHKKKDLERAINDLERVNDNMIWKKKQMKKLDIITKYLVD